MGGYISHLLDIFILYFFLDVSFTRPTLIRSLPPRPRTDARMHMWGQLFPKRGPCSAVDKDICDLLALEDDRDVFDLVLYSYMGMD